MSIQFSLPGVLKDLLALLEQWPSWKRIKATPDRMDELEKRVAELEAMLAAPRVPACPRCGQSAFRTTESKPHRHNPIARLGARQLVRKCDACGFEDVETRMP